jgi:hypothetical protein
MYELTCLSLRDPALTGLGKWQYDCYFQAAAQFLEDLAAAAGTKWRLPIPVASRMFVTFIDGVILGWLADRNDEQALDALDGFVDQLAAFTEPAANAAAGPGWTQ